MGADKTVGVVTSGKETSKTTTTEDALLNEWNKMEFSWLRVARSQMGVSEVPGSGNSKQVLEYHATTTLKATQDSVPWCSSFVNWCMEQAGYRGTKSAAAASWLSYGSECGEFKPHGSIVILKRKGGNHVGFLVGSDQFNVYLLGGNQADAVNIRPFAHSLVRGYVLPKELNDDDDLVFEFQLRHGVA